MISGVLSSTKPAPAADRPVNAFSIEITTGMSAPPTGMISITPNTSEAISIATNSASLSVPLARKTAATRIPSSRAPFRILLAGEQDRPARHQLLQLGERDQRAGEADRSDDAGEHGSGSACRAAMSAGLGDADRGTRKARPARPRRRRRR